MGYSVSPATIFSNEDLLRPLLDSNEPEIRMVFTEITAPKKAQKIRECFHVANLYPHNFHKLVRISQEREIRVEGACVVARLRIGKSPFPITEPQTIHLSKATFPEIIQAQLDNPTAEKLVVDTAITNDSDNTQLRNWISANPGWTHEWSGARLTILMPKVVDASRSE